jgi:hypothetical protein
MAPRTLNASGCNDSSKGKKQTLKKHEADDALLVGGSGGGGGSGGSMRVADMIQRNRAFVQRGGDDGFLRR